jgi:putative phage-type endonuclease
MGDVLSYLTNCKVFSTVLQEEDEAAWKAARSRGIGGSDIGTICGVNKWSSARQLYLKKTGMYEEDFDNAANERMHFGHVLEPIVASEYERRTGNKVVCSPATLVHKDYPWALANVDRLIVDAEGKPFGILECKTASEYMADEWEEGNVPISYVYQLNWYLGITGLKYGCFAAIVGGNKFFTYEMPFNEELFNEILIPAANKFWNYNVKQMIEPELDGNDASTEFCKQEYPADGVVRNSERVLEGSTYNELANTIVDAKAKVKEYEKVIAEASNRIKDELKDKEIGYTEDHIIKWSPRQRTAVDTKYLAEHYPDAYRESLKTSSYRVFTVK